MDFGSRLRQLRIENGLSLEQVAMMVGITRPTIYRYETGAIRNVPPDMVHKLANLFGVTRPYLMGWTDEPGVNPHENLEKVADNMRSNHEGEIVENNGVKFWRAKSVKGVDCTTAATQAVRALIKYGIARTPIYPQHIIQHSDQATFITYDNEDDLQKHMIHLNVQTMQNHNGLFHTCSFYGHNKSPEYLFVVNRNVNIGKLKLSLAVELGHIYLGHTSMVRDSARKQQEAECFAMHLVFPRPAIKLLEERGFLFTKQSFSMIFGDCEWCIDSILTAHPVEVNPELNRLLKEQFIPYINKLDSLGVLQMPVDGNPIDLGNYMAGYSD